MKREAKDYRDYKSPRRKLLAFFEKSRDRWKEKYAALKINMKRLENQLYYTKKKKDALKAKVKNLEAEVKRLQCRQKPQAKKNTTNQKH